jgi:cell division septal protein FtsQ
MTRNSSIPSVKDISSSIKSKRRKARQLLFRRLFAFIVTMVVISLIGISMYTIDQSSMFRIQSIIVSHTRLTDEAEVRSALPFSEGDRQWIFHPWWTNIPIDDDAIESINFVMNNRTMIVEVKEFKPLAISESHILLSNGQYYPLNPRHRSILAYLPSVDGFIESELSVKLANALIELEDFVLNLMASIEQTPLSYDEAMMVITLDNGLNIYSDLRSLILLNQLPLFIDLINEDNNCLYLDSVTSTARAAPCP